MKRALDMTVSLLALTLGAPLFLLIALLVGEAPLFCQQRVGKGGKLFWCFKFRTMVPNAESKLQQLLEDESVRNEWERQWKLKSDPRITRIGRWLRRTSLDELPQFWNVLKGEMSLVGPRPVVPEESFKLPEVRPGITGLWQVSGRSHTTYERRIALDQAYVEQRTFWLDLQLILKTIPVMVRQKGAL